MNIISSATPGSTVRVNMAPNFIFVEYKPKCDWFQNQGKLSPNDYTSLFPDDPDYRCVSINISSKKTAKLSNIVVGDKLFKTIEYKVAMVEVFYACTFDKCQGLLYSPTPQINIYVYI